MTQPLHLPTPAYGGDYNPEQWDEATVARDIQLMREAGVTMVSLAIFSWARLEPSKGEYHLDDLAQMIDRLHDAGIMVDLATATASPPAWMATEHPETLPVTADGVRLGFGSRQQYCPSSPFYRERSAALAAQLADRFADHPAVVMWHIGNEYGCHVHECFCEECTRQFRSWLLQRHGDLEGINRAWGTDFWSQRYMRVEEITPPAAMPTFRNPGQVLDWRRFCDHQIRALMLGEIDQIRSRSDKPVTTNFMGAFPWLDYREWAKHLDVITDDSYPEPSDPGAAGDVAWQGDLMRGLAGGQPWILMEQSPGAVQWRTRNAPKRPGQFKLWSYGRMAHGADGVLQFQVRQSKQGSETFHAGMIPHAETASRTWREVAELGGELAGLAEVVGTIQTSDVAVVFDWESDWATRASIGPTDWSHLRAARDWHRSLWEAGIATDVVGRDADFSAYKLVIVPSMLIDAPETAEAARRAARDAGTHVLVVGPTAVVDGDMRAVLGGYLGAWRSLAGVRVTDHAGLTAGLMDGVLGQDDPTPEPADAAARGGLVSRLSRAVGTPGAADHVELDIVDPQLERARDLVLDRLSPDAPVKPGLRGGRWAEEVEVLGAVDGAPQADVIAAFAPAAGSLDLGGMPALTRRVIGEGGASGSGAVWYLATDADVLTRAVLIGLIGAHARVRPVVADLPDGVEAQLRTATDGSGRGYLFLLNHSDRAVELAGITGDDLISGAAVTGHMMLAPRSTAVIRRTV